MPVFSKSHRLMSSFALVPRTPKTDPEKNQLKFRLPSQKVKTSTEAKFSGAAAVTSAGGSQEDYDGDTEF